VRFLFLLPILVALCGCAGSGPAFEPPLPRSTYQKVNVAPYAGAAGDGVTARGNRYQRGAISSAAADWARWPAGTLFRVLATGEIYEVDDFTDDIVGTNTILLYKPSAATMPGAGPRLVTIEIVRWGSPRDSAEMLRLQKSSTAKKILAELVERYPQKR
jgi:hypothetical protein